MLTILAALTLATTTVPAQAAALPARTPPQTRALRCSVVFARGARMQADRNPAAAGWPPLALRGKDYFVRVLARLMDDTGAGRDALAALAARELPGLKTDSALAAAMPGCLSLLDASGS